MSDAAYQVLIYAARYWFAALALFIAWRAGVSTLREYRIVRDIRRRIEGVRAYCELVVLQDPTGKLIEGERYPFAGDALLGSGADCDLRVRHKGIARRHLRLTVEEDCVRIRPIRGREALLDGQEIRAETLAFSGSELTLGRVVFCIRTKEAFDEA